MQTSEQYAPPPDPHKTFLTKISQWIWSAPESSENKFQRFLRAFCRIHLIVYQEFLQDRISLRSSALTFTVVLSMVPMLALGTAVLKGLGAGGQMRQAAYGFIEQLESTALSPDVTAPSASPENANQKIPGEIIEIPEDPPDADIEDEQTDTSLTMHLKRAVDMVFDYVEKTNFATLGAIGILGLVLSVVSVLSSIEVAMNDIWQTVHGRGLIRKVMDYLALMILLPITINVGVATMAALQSRTLQNWFQKIVPWIGPLMFKIMPILAVVLTFTILYIFLPNTKVKPLAALTGGIYGGIFWLLAQTVYIKLQIGVARYNAIYGSFATLPLFLVWIYVGWMIFLAGAEMSFACQIWRTYLWKKRPLTPMSKLALTFDILKIIITDYKARRLTTRATLVDALGKADEHIKEIIDDLEEAGIIRRVKHRREKGYVPAGPSESMNAAEISRLILDYEKIDISSENPALEVRRAIEAALSNLTIPS